MKNLSLLKNEVDAINEIHIKSVDKLYRMHAGISSLLKAVERGIAYLEVDIHRGWPKSNRETAQQFIDSWRNGSEILHSLSGWDVKIFYSDSIAGFAASVTEMASPFFQKKLASLNDTSERKLVFLYRTIYSQNRIPSIQINDKYERFDLEYPVIPENSESGFFHLHRKENVTMANTTVSGNLFVVPNNEDDYLALSENESDSLKVSIISASRLSEFHNCRGSFIYLLNLNTERSAVTLFKILLNDTMRARVMISRINF